VRREGLDVGRDPVARLMGTLGPVGAPRTRRVRTTLPAPVAQRPADLVERVFSAPAPNRLWVADLTYVWTSSGFVYSAFIVDAFTRAIVGWRVSANLRTDLALDALEMALHARGAALPGLVQSLRSRVAIPGHPLLRAPRRGGRGQLGRLEGRQLGQPPWPRRLTASTKPS
jgi:putative transposase